MHPANGSEESNLEKLSRNYKIFRSYIGQFCSDSAHGLLKNLQDFANEDSFAQLFPEDESIGDENEDFNV